MITLDASCLIALLEAGDPHHETATSILRAFETDQVQIHTINLAEVLTGGVRGGQGAEMMAAIEAIDVTTAPGVPNEALRLAEIRHTTGLKLPDCCALLTAKANGFTLVTFDITLAKAARQQGVTVIDQPTR